MSGIDELVNDPPEHHGPVEGIVVKPVPVSVTDPLYVRVVGLNDRLTKVGPCPWMPRVDDDGLPVLPDEDNPCAVSFTDANTPWVLGYWPEEEVPSG